MAGQGITLGKMSAALEALARLGSAFPGLPGGQVTVSNVFPERLSVLFSDCGAFEAWRCRLGISPEAVELRPLRDGEGYLVASLEWDGVLVELAVCRVVVAESAVAA